MIAWQTKCKSALRILLQAGDPRVGASTSEQLRTLTHANRDVKDLTHEQKRANSFSCFLWYMWYALHIGLLASIPLVNNKWWILFMQGRKLPLFLACSTLTCCVLLHMNLFQSDPGVTSSDIASNILSPMQPSVFSDHTGIEGKNAGLPSCRQEYCEKCHLPKLLRSKHCRICGKCIRMYDHHCVWLGTCVGEKNQRNFCIFLFLETALLLAFIDAVLQGFSPIFRANSMSGWLRHNILGMIGIAVPLLFLCLLLPHFIMQVVFVLTNQTSREFFDRSTLPYLADVPDNVHPFSKGAIMNLYLFCMQRHPEHYQLPSRQEMLELGRTDTLWENKFYSCF
mmetsp:Transcript_4764/g.30144  ORF Transcript_4764/g.30144 Transcript_4764/m.30144 type:complete len:339 (+) Transcript_4764:996-2012(+)